ncbi:MAG: hypothetical protein ACKVPJ_08690 [Chitinophagales bacterium]
MKSLRFFLFLTTLLSIHAVYAQKPATLTVSYEFSNIVEGYDHNTYCEVWIDGVKAGESSRGLESKPNSFTIQTTRGIHNVEIKNFAEYQGTWEEHLVANEYSIDCYYSQSMNLKKKNKLKLLFDIDKGTIVK